jgi:hypothetical protein
LFEYDLFGKPVATFPDHARGNKKAPDLFEAGLRWTVMRPTIYARTTPQARGGFLVFVVVFVIIGMARDHMGRQGRRQRRWN